MINYAKDKTANNHKVNFHNKCYRHRGSNQIKFQHLLGNEPETTRFVSSAVTTSPGPSTMNTLHKNIYFFM